MNGEDVIQELCVKVLGAGGGSVGEDGQGLRVQGQLYGGLAGLTAASVCLTGVEGAMLAPLFAKVFHVTDPVAEGVAIGACSHAVGTTKALEMGELEGAMTGVSIAVSGLLTTASVIIASCFV